MNFQFFNSIEYALKIDDFTTKISGMASVGSSGFYLFFISFSGENLINAERKLLLAISATSPNVSFERFYLSLSY